MTIRLIGFIGILGITNLLCAAAVEYAGDGTTAVVSSTVPLVYTEQVLGADPGSALAALDERLRRSGGDAGAVVKLHIVVKTGAMADAARRAIVTKYPQGHRPPATIVVGNLPDEAAVIAIDAIALNAKAHARSSPSSLVFISGQAEKGATPLESAANTLTSLTKALEFVGSKPSDVLHARCFLTPISTAEATAREIKKVLGEQVSVAFVEWKSNLPIEIELVATAPPPAAPDAPAVEYLTQEGVTASPIFSRIARVNHGDLVFSGGLYGAESGSGEAQVLSIFGQLEKILAANGSDLKHLVKATYYVSDNDSSTQLNVLRPKYYDPKRPPAASKAMVPGVGMPDRSITIDMIAVRATP